ncbi:hypothetical protein V8C86DRAFT_3107355 [Haematococcus lacustris]
MTTPSRRYFVADDDSAWSGDLLLDLVSAPLAPMSGRDDSAFALSSVRVRLGPAEPVEEEEAVPEAEEVPDEAEAVPVEEEEAEAVPVEEEEAEAVPYEEAEAKAEAGLPVSGTKPTQVDRMARHFAALAAPAASWPEAAVLDMIVLADSTGPAPPAQALPTQPTLPLPSLPRQPLQSLRSQLVTQLVQASKIPLTGLVEAMPVTARGYGGPTLDAAEVRSKARDFMGSKRAAMAREGDDMQLLAVCALTDDSQYALRCALAGGLVPAYGAKRGFKGLFAMPAGAALAADREACVARVVELALAQPKWESLWVAYDAAPHALTLVERVMLFGASIVPDLRLLAQCGHTFSGLNKGQLVAALVARPRPKAAAPPPPFF